jgi:urease accessory protein UreF
MNYASSGKKQDIASKEEYAAAIRREKIKSWKEFCNVTSATNPWNAIYKMVAEKTKRATHITTLRIQDGSLTTNLQDTLLHMIQKFSPDDNQEDDIETARTEL